MHRARGQETPIPGPSVIAVAIGRTHMSCTNHEESVIERFGGGNTNADLESASTRKTAEAVLRPERQA